MSTSCCWYCMFFEQTTAVATRAAESKVWIRFLIPLKIPNSASKQCPNWDPVFKCLKNRLCFSPVSGIGESSASDELDSCNLWKNWWTKNMGNSRNSGISKTRHDFFCRHSLLGQLANILGLDPIYIASFLQLSDISFSAVQYAMAINGRNRWVIKPPFSLVTVQVNA